MTGAGATTSSITVRFLVDLLDQGGLRADELLQQAGLTRAQLDSVEMSVPVAIFDQLWARAASTQPDIGLNLIERFPPGQMHIVTHLALRSANVREALEAVVKFARVTQAKDRFDLTVTDQVVELRYTNQDLASGARFNPWLVEHFLAMCCVLLARATGQRLPVLAVHLRAGAQAPIPAYLARFGVCPQFNSATDCIVFDSSALDWPLLTHDAYLREILERFALGHLPPPDDSLSDRVRERLRRAWIMGQGLQIDDIARACALGSDTLRDRLANEGTNFRQLKDDCRRELARVHLSGRMSNGEIAYALGFSEPAALQHACKRWFGRSVGDFRRSLRDASPDAEPPV